MNRRDFLKRLGGAAAAVTLSPLLDALPIEPAPEPAFNEEWGGPYVFKIIGIYNLTTHNPRRLGVISVTA